MLTDSFGLGGLEKQLYHLLDRLSSTGDFELAVFLKKNMIEQKNVNKTCKVYCSSSAGWFDTFLNLKRAVKDFKPDIIHSWEGMLTFFAIPIAKLNAIPIVNGQIRNALKRNFFNKGYLTGRWNFFFSDYVISNSYAGLNVYNITESKKNLVIQNGFDIEEFDKSFPDDNILTYTNDGKNIIGKVANFTRPKDYDTLVRAGMSLLNERNDVKFIFIGDGPNLERVRSQIPESLTDHFTFLGKRSDAEKWIKIFDVCILLSPKGLCEGLSNSIMEYMAAAKPVIATDDGGNPELIGHGVNGFLIPHEDENVLKEKTGLLLDNKDLRNKMGIAGRSKIKEDFDVEKMVDRYKNLYWNLVN